MVVWSMVVGFGAGVIFMLVFNWIAVWALWPRRKP
jgi:hypothetical protein